jgi:hypothetical protein
MLKWMLAVVLFVLLIGIGAKTVVPYVFVINSVPGQRPLSDQDRSLLLKTPVVRMASVDDERRVQVLQTFAGRDTDALARNERSGGVKLSQIILANLLLSHDVERGNALLQELTVWGNAGSSWERNKAGDYDFGLIWLTAILYEFGENDAVLFPESRDYLLNVLLTEEGRLNRTVPRSGGMVFETENHLLMREGSRYLKNQWLKAHGSVPARLDNDLNGLGTWLEQFLNHMRLSGVYEYNSTPYAVYTLLPLMNLADYAESATLRTLAESVIDNILSRYAYGSLGLRQCAPFRRQFKYAENPSLLLNRLSDLVRFQLDETARCDKLLILASVLHDYRMSAQTRDRFAGRIEYEYVAFFAHAAKGGAEIYSGGPGYLLSAGGTYQGAGAKVIARPIALFVNDGAETLEECIHIQGIGDWKIWNMSGVHRRFAVAKGTVHIPERFKPDNAAAGWHIFHATDGVDVACYQEGELAMLVVFPELRLPLNDVLGMLREANPAPDQSQRFVWPEALAPEDVRTVSFDVDADAQLWVITAVNGQHPVPMTGRRFEDWPARYAY